MDAAPALPHQHSLARQVWDAAASDRISLTAAGCAFYAMLALFPALSLVVSLYGTLLDVRTLEPQIEILRRLLPEETFELIATRLHDLVAAERRGLGWGAVVSGSIALWSAAAGIRAMLAALNMAWSTTDQRGFIYFHVLSLGLTLAAMLVAATAIALLVLMPPALAFLGVPPLDALYWQAASLGLTLAFVFLGVVMLYRVGPAGGGQRWRRIVPGAAIATLIWAFASAAFSLYVGSIADYDRMYGTLGAAIGLLMWFYVSIYVVLLGAEVNVAVSRRDAEQTSLGGNG
ncbi:MAG: YihY/virulence factor BrkB family protein [Pseudomonadota bacterium]